MSDKLLGDMDQFPTTPEEVSSPPKPDLAPNRNNKPYTFAAKILIVIILIIGIIVFQFHFGIISSDTLTNIFNENKTKKTTETPITRNTTQRNEDTSPNPLAEESKIQLSMQLGTIFVMGGRAETGAQGFYQPTNIVEYYTPSTGKWTIGPSMIIPRSSAAAAVVDSKIYIFGGTSNNIHGSFLTSFEKFDPDTNTWTNIGDMPIGRFSEVALSVNNRIYILGGYTTDYKRTTRIDIYDPSTNTWSQGQDMPATFSTDTGQDCDAIFDKIYCPHLGDNSYTLVYDTKTDTWSNLPTESRSTIRSGIGSVVDGQFVMLPNNGGSPNYLSIYNPANDNLTQEGPYHRMLHQFNTVSVGDYFAVMGGDFSSGPENEVYAINIKYPKIWFRLPDMNVPRYSFSAVTLPSRYGDFIHKAKIHGYIQDSDGNGKKGVPVALGTTHLPLNHPSLKHTDPGSIIGFTTTDKNGYYSFNSLAPGKYQVMIQQAIPGAYYVAFYNGVQTVDIRNDENIKFDNYIYRVFEKTEEAN